ALHVRIVDETPRENIHVLDMQERRIVAHDTEVSGLLPVGNVVSVAPPSELIARRERPNTADPVLDGRNVSCREAYGATGRQALVRFARALPPDVDAVGHEAHHVFHHAPLEPVAETQHEHEHENAPHDPQRRHQRPELVPPQGVQHLLPLIQIEQSPGHSSRIAATGLTRAARRAGTSPAKTPVVTRMPTATRAMRKSTSGFLKYSLSGK